MLFWPRDDRAAPGSAPRRGNAHWQPGRPFPASAPGAVGRGRDPLRRHAGHGEARGAFQPFDRAPLVPGPARERTRRGASPASRKRRDGRARLRRRDARPLGSWRAPGRRGGGCRVRRLRRSGPPPPRRLSRSRTLRGAPPSSWAPAAAGERRRFRGRPGPDRRPSSGSRPRTAWSNRSRRPRQRRAARPAAGS